MARESERKIEAARLIEKGRNLSDIQAEGAPPFHMQAHVRLLHLTGPPAEGTFLLDWISPRQNRQQLTFSGYSEELVTKENLVWGKSSLDHEPYLIHQVHQALQFPARLLNGPIINPKNVNKVREKKLNSAPALCVELKSEPAFDRELCFDSDAGYLVHALEGTWKTSYEFSDYVPVAGRTFPRTMRILQNNQDNRPIVDVKIEELVLESSADAAIFAPPPGARIVALTSCLKTERAHLLGGGPPQYPESAKRRGISGDVIFYADLGTDGQPRGLTVIQSVSPELDAAASFAVNHWRYRPTLCNDLPVDVITTIEVKFQLH